ncbi:hypothetical protein KGQ19_15455 [Catenulispora sp. NL8]|uniref:Uncharacterized protein n=1 Tax=Catenulispora pinistramenti TaxID=2705254 RepID=A0ABS5KQC6_9ACTN|nr:hypothetical protein [Catenulispora pinistramenti]MBS2548261.1 hypothetical protein [Catenulispora pinistramenti]
MSKFGFLIVAGLVAISGVTASASTASKAGFGWDTTPPAIASATAITPTSANGFGWD